MLEMAVDAIGAARGIWIVDGWHRCVMSSQDLSLCKGYVRKRVRRSCREDATMSDRRADRRVARNGCHPCIARNVVAAWLARHGTSQLHGETLDSLCSMYTHRDATYYDIRQISSQLYVQPVSRRAMRRECLHGHIALSASWPSAGVYQLIALVITASHHGLVVSWITSDCIFNCSSLRAPVTPRDAPLMMFAQSRSCGPLGQRTGCPARLRSSPSRRCQKCTSPVRGHRFVCRAQGDIASSDMLMLASASASCK